MNHHIPLLLLTCFESNVHLNKWGVNWSAECRRACPWVEGLLRSIDDEDEDEDEDEDDDEDEDEDDDDEDDDDDDDEWSWYLPWIHVNSQEMTCFGFKGRFNSREENWCCSSDKNGWGFVVEKGMIRLECFYVFTSTHHSTYHFSLVTCKWNHFQRSAIPQLNHQGLDKGSSSELLNLESSWLCLACCFGQVSQVQKIDGLKAFCNLQLPGWCGHHPLEF